MDSEKLWEAFVGCVNDMNGEAGGEALLELAQEYDNPPNSGSRGDRQGHGRDNGRLPRRVHGDGWTSTRTRTGSRDIGSRDALVHARGCIRSPLFVVRK